MKIGFYSTMRGNPWGGSEELWSRAAGVLLAQGHEVDICYSPRKPITPRLKALLEGGAQMHRYSRIQLGHRAQNLLRSCGYRHRPFSKWLRSSRPDFLLVSAGYHIDNLGITATCRALGIPYGLLLQAAGPCHWIESWDFDAMRAAYLCAERLFFVSDQNRRTVEDNLAIDLSRAEIVDNPFNVRPDARPAWTPADDTLAAPWRLASVGRLSYYSKGQDVLLRVLRMPKWRARPLEITFYGSESGSQRAMEETILAHGLERQAKLAGFAGDIEHVWSQHHGLVLPSRFEGNPLVLIEALLCGRIAITTNVGRAAELVDDNESGFLAPTATADEFDAALERAWLRRHDWQTMGALAARSLRQRHSLQPEVDFAQRLVGAETAKPALSRAA